MVEHLQRMFESTPTGNVYGANVRVVEQPALVVASIAGTVVVASVAGGALGVGAPVHIYDASLTTTVKHYPTSQTTIRWDIQAINTIGIQISFNAGSVYMRLDDKGDSYGGNLNIGTLTAVASAAGGAIQAIAIVL